MTGSQEQAVDTAALIEAARRSLVANDLNRTVVLSNQVLAADPYNVGAYFLLAIAINLSGNHAVAARLYRICIVLGPTEITFQQGLSDCLGATGTPEVALAHLERYLRFNLAMTAMSTASKLPWGGLYDAGIQMVLAGKAEQSVRYYLSAVARTPEHLPLLRHLLTHLFWCFGSPSLGADLEQSRSRLRAIVSESLAVASSTSRARASALLVAAVATLVQGDSGKARRLLRAATAVRPVFREALAARAIQLSEIRTQTAEKDTLYFIYDLFEYPNSYNFHHLLIFAELRRRRLGYHHLHVVFVGRREPGQEDWSRASLYSDAEHEFRVENLLAPTCYLLPSCRGVSVLGTREELRRLLARVGNHVLPQGYDPDLPYLRIEYDASLIRDAIDKSEAWPRFQAPASHRELIGGWLKARARRRRVVAITLRRNFEDLTRNSQFEVWLEFARGLDPARYCVVFVDDTKSIFTRPPAALEENLHFCDLASLTVAFRLALYERAFVNLLTVNGPVGLVMHAPEVRYIITNVGSGIGINATQSIKTLIGLKPGENFPIAGPFQRLVWQPETLPNIRSAFERMVSDLERTGLGQP